jgi:hypothetical protein
MNTENRKPLITNSRGEPITGRQLIFPILFISIPAVIAFWMEIADMWPANYISDLQAKWFNGYYYPKITFAVIWMTLLIICVIPARVILTIVRKIKNKKHEN